MSTTQFNRLGMQVRDLLRRAFRARATYFIDRSLWNELTPTERHHVNTRELGPRLGNEIFHLAELHAEVCGTAPHYEHAIELSAEVVVLKVSDWNEMMRLLKDELELSDTIEKRLPQVCRGIHYG